MSDAAKGRDGRKQAGSKPEAFRDWAAVRARFVAASLSTREFAATEGIPYSTIAKRAASEGWLEAREASRAKVAAGVVKGHEKRRIYDESVIDGSAHRVAQRLTRMVAKLLASATELSLDDIGKLKTAAETVEKSHRLARVTAHLLPEPEPRVEADEMDAGDLVIRRNRPDGSEVEVRSGGAPTDSDRPHRPHPDTDAVGVPPRSDAD